MKYGETFTTFADNRCSYCGDTATTLVAWKEGTCLHGRVRDWSTTYGMGSKHFYCPDCGRHWFNGKEYSSAEWEVYVNEEDEKLGEKRWI